MFHAQIAQRAFNTPLLVEPSKAMAFLAGLGPRITGRQVRLVGGLAVAPDDVAHAALPSRTGILTNGLAEEYRRDGQTPFAMVDGIAVIEVSGVLVHRGSWIGQSSGQTSYEGIAAQLAAAVADPAVRGIALEIDSFGGEVAGVFDLADAIRAARASKPVQAFVAEHAFSAGYALASQATSIILPRTGAVGSIGVVVMHADLSGQLSDDGVTVTLIHSGAHKVDGNPYEPLPDAVRARIQGEIDSIRTLFAQTVAAGRGRRLTAEAALTTEADCYRGADAVTAGLADEVSDPASAFAAFADAVNGRPARSAMLGRAPRSQISKEVSMKPNATAAAIEAAIEPEDQAVPAQPSPAPAEPATVPAPAPTEAASAVASAVALMRAEAAEIVTLGALAAKLGVTIDAADAVQKGIKPEALRKTIIIQAAAISDATAVSVVPPPKSAAPESPLLAAVKRATSEAA